MLRGSLCTQNQTKISGKPSAENRRLPENHNRVQLSIARLNRIFRACLVGKIRPEYRSNPLRQQWIQGCACRMVFRKAGRLL